MAWIATSHTRNHCPKRTHAAHPSREVGCTSREWNEGCCADTIIRRVRMREESIRVQAKGHAGPFDSKAPTSTENVKSILFDRAVLAATDRLKAIRRAHDKLSSLGECTDCNKFSIDYAKRTIAEAELWLSRANQRAVRVARRIARRG